MKIFRGIARSGDNIDVAFRDGETRTKARNAIGDMMPDVQIAEQGAGERLAGHTPDQQTHHHEDPLHACFPRARGRLHP